MNSTAEKRLAANAMQHVAANGGLPGGGGLLLPGINTPLVLAPQVRPRP